MPESDLPALRARILNFRDLGGFPARDGRQFRPGMVYRTQALTNLSPQAAAELEALGITHAVDLRMEHERVALPVQLPDTMTVVVADVMSDRADSAAAAAGAATAPAAAAPAGGDVPPASGRAMMMATYRDFIHLPSAQVGYAAMVRTVIEADGATAIYCAAGKDRTGWGAALLQTFAGVDASIVIREYAASNEHLVTRYAPRIQAEREAGGDLDALLALVDAHPDYLASALEAMDAAYGGVDGYLVQALGLSERELELLHERITAPSS